jgi:hypothetical protein
MQANSPLVRHPRAPRSRPRRPCAQRRAAIALELILVLPILVILVLGVVQFGLFFVNMQQVALASRVGAKEASQTPGLYTTDGAPVPANILDAIEHQLTTSGIEHCRVRLEHNLGGQQVTLFSPGQDACDCGPSGELAEPLPPGAYVRLSVSVPMSELMPNCLRVFGFDVSSPCKVARSTTILRHDWGP